MNKFGFMYIYVLQVPPGFKKVGIARDVQRRIAEIRTGNPHTVKLAYTRMVPADMAHRVEKRAHHLLKPFHVRGEWFQAELRPVYEAIHTAMKEAGIEIETQREFERPLIQAIARAKRVRSGSNGDSVENPEELRISYET